MPENGISPDFHGKSEQELAKESERLTQRGELVCYDGARTSGKPIQIAMALEPAVANANGGRVLELVYESRTGLGTDGKDEKLPLQWFLRDQEILRQGDIRGEQAFIDGVPGTVGRLTFTEHIPEETAKKAAVSGTHLSIITGGRYVTIVQQGGNPTYFEAPAGSMRLATKLPPQAA